MNQSQFAEETGPRSTFQQVFSFPNPVNESAARLVAGMVVALTSSIIIFEAY